MTSNPVAHAVTYEEYLAREASSGTKLEYLRGEVLDMSGGTPEHGAIAMALGAALTLAIAGRPCRVFSSDVKVRVDATDLSAFPDLSVVCGSLLTSPRDANAIVNPVLLIEVLSPTSEAYDRGAKFGHYRRLESLKEMVFVNHESQRVEVYRRNETGRFELYVFEADEVVELTSVNARIPVAKIYENPLSASTPPAPA
jgi:Uma2 family endonuclease